jgi:hypothetical protein
MHWLIGVLGYPPDSETSPMALRADTCSGAAMGDAVGDMLTQHG